MNRPFVEILYFEGCPNHEAALPNAARHVRTTRSGMGRRRAARGRGVRGGGHPDSSVGAAALEHLFEAELRYQTGITPLLDRGDGVFVGSGDGTLAGPVLTGTLRWTLFEQPGELVCAMSPTVQIETSDGALIRADGRGFATREAVEAREWRVAATLRFRTDDTRYAWLDGALGTWAGDFDSERHVARYRAYLHPRDHRKKHA